MSTPIRAAIVPTGDITPVYNGVDDPWVVATLLGVGDSGVGSLTIDGSSSASSVFTVLGFLPNSIGTAIVADSGSLIQEGSLFVGSQGHGTLHVINGGTVTANNLVSIGSSVGSFGSVTISGLGSSFSNQTDMYVGNSSTGELYVDGGGVVSTIRIYVGQSEGSSGTVQVSGVDSAVNVQFEIDLARNGTAAVEVLDGGTMTGRTGFIGNGNIATVSGTGSLWSTTQQLYVGYSGDGSLLIQNGGKVKSFHGFVGNSGSATGRVDVSGISSWWDNASVISIGREYQNHGVLNIEAGGMVSSHDVNVGEFTGSAGEVTVTGSGSSLMTRGSLIVGKSGAGTLNVESGGIVDVVEDTIVAEKPWATGEINFDGGVLRTGNLWAASTALKGMGTINTKGLISDTDVVFDAVSGLQTQVVLNNEPGQNITINLDASDPTFNRVLGSGYGGTGTMTIKDGLMVDSLSGYMGLGSGSHGTTTVTGPGSMWSISDELQVGGNGIGRFIIEDGGSVTSATSYVGSLSNSNGLKSTASVTGAGSVWNVTASLYVGGNQSSLNRPGEVTVGAGGLLDVAGTMNVLNAGSVLGGGGIHAATLSNRGSVKPGDGVGALTLVGDYIQESDGSLHIELAGGGGVLGVDSDVLIVDGDVNLDGSLHLISVGGYLPSIGDTFEVLQSTGTITGVFSSLVVSGGTGLVFRPIYSADSISLITAMVGDLDEDGFVGISDLNLVLSHWNQVTTPGDWLAGDFNGDGFTGIIDLNAVLGNWNAGTPPTVEGGSTIPEPSMMVLMGVAGAMISRRSVARN